MTKRSVRNDNTYYVILDLIEDPRFFLLLDSHVNGNVKILPGSPQSTWMTRKIARNDRNRSREWQRESVRNDNTYVILEGRPTVIPEIFYRESIVTVILESTPIVIPNLIGDPDSFPFVWKRNTSWIPVIALNDK
jgi:hypothetical protein